MLRIAASVVGVFVLFGAVSACSTYETAGVAGTDASVYAEERNTQSPAKGQWVGTWSAVGSNGDGGQYISALCIQKGPGEWLATFDAVCNAEYSFTVEMTGRQEGDKVIFEGDADLGEQYGGVFHWSGIVENGKFLGKYKAANYDGSFEMTKAEPEEVSMIFCPAPGVAGVTATVAEAGLQ